MKKTKTGESLAEEETREDESLEDEFLEGYEEDEEVVECAECGSACPEERRIVQEIDGEKQTFCSKHCAREFEESIGSTEE